MTANIELPPSQHYINGEWVGGGDRVIPVINPADGTQIGEIPSGDQHTVGAAVSAARAAFHNPHWRNMPPMVREGLMHRLASLIEENASQLGQIESLDNGKPIAFSSSVDVPMTITWFRYFAGWCSKLSGKSLSPALQPLDSHHAYTRRQPVGVVGAIVPWNFPLVLAAWKLAPALAAGCTVILKPAEQTPYSALKLAELISEAGFPPGVFNLVLGDGQTGQALVEHPGINKISFTGSTAVGKSIVRSVAHDLKRVTLELGGKSPTIILPDADMELAIPGAAQAVYANAGQICFAGTRLFAPRKQFDRILEGIASVAETFKIGPGLDPETLLGPVVSQKQMDGILARVDDSVRHGASLFTGGTRHGDSGYFISPSILVTEDRQNPAFREEFFGPVLCATPYDDLNDVAALANDSSYGLAAHVYTSSLQQAHQLSNSLDAGTVWVNTQLSPDPNIPFGGFKQSGWGRENAEDALDHYTETKSVIMKVDC
ncbi:aldehyde dehydrogenase family protein [Spongiibacter taiwanensis]|uniref:aldehyde dehydrogenase family protein n=1 Tax=Spongiibacter taiwanensis TaxID=1748242 RepID=UPI002036401C|nr:aldehyde dehydrogenase family protein [Spongiibacter taiwanensis]USA44701.1 aldehyde dehydrogenase family protein [Spongiibacter taiwanensis]